MGTSARSPAAFGRGSPGLGSESISFGESTSGDAFKVNDGGMIGLGCEMGGANGC